MSKKINTRLAAFCRIVSANTGKRRFRINVIDLATTIGGLPDEAFGIYGKGDFADTDASIMKKYWNNKPKNQSSRSQAWMRQQLQIHNCSPETEHGGEKIPAWIEFELEPENNNN